jgi:hypothetical protein
MTGCSLWPTGVNEWRRKQAVTLFDLGVSEIAILRQTIGNAGSCTFNPMSSSARQPGRGRRDRWLYEQGARRRQQPRLGHQLR